MIDILFITIIAILCLTIGLLVLAVKANIYLQLITLFVTYCSMFLVYYLTGLLLERINNNGHK